VNKSALTLAKSDYSSSANDTFRSSNTSFINPTSTFCFIPTAANQFCDVRLPGNNITSCQNDELPIFETPLPTVQSTGGPSYGLRNFPFTQLCNFDGRAQVQDNAILPASEERPRKKTRRDTSLSTSDDSIFGGQQRSCPENFQQSANVDNSDLSPETDAKLREWLDNCTMPPTNDMIETAAWFTKASVNAIRNWLPKASLIGSFPTSSRVQFYPEMTSIAGTAAAAVDRRTTQPPSPAPIPNGGVSESESDRRLLQKFIDKRRNGECRTRVDHDKQGEYVCTYNCGYRTERKHSWDRHEKCRQPQTFWICNQCRVDGEEELFVASRKDKLRDHCRAKHKIEGTDSLDSVVRISKVANPGIFVRICPYGTYRFQSWEDRIAHLVSHFKNEPLNCNRHDSAISLVPTKPHNDFHPGGSRYDGEPPRDSKKDDTPSGPHGSNHSSTQPSGSNRRSGYGPRDEDILFTTYSFSLDLFDSTFEYRPSFIDSLEYVGPLGHGSSACVEEVRHDRTRRIFARKNFYESQPTMFQNFVQEVQIMRRLRHPSIVRFVAAYQYKSHLSVVMEPVAENDLDKYLADQKNANKVRESILPWFLALTSGMSYLHAQHICHGDIKLSNILLLRSSVLYTDFGRSREDPSVAQVNHVREGDMFALGVVLLQLVAASLGRTIRTLPSFGIDGSNTPSISESPPNISWKNITIPDLRMHTDVILGKLLEVCQSLLQASPAERPTAWDLAATVERISHPLVQNPSQPAKQWSRSQTRASSSFVAENGSVDCRLPRVRADHNESPLEWTFTFTFRESFGYATEFSQDIAFRHVSIPGMRYQEVHPTCSTLLPRRLIDLGIRDEEVSLRATSDISGAGKPIAYAAIDHCWILDPPAAVESLPRPGSLNNWASLPLTFRQAVVVVRRLRFRYLWVESICILDDEYYDQASPSIERIAFENARMTLIVATASRSNARCFNHDTERLFPAALGDKGALAKTTTMDALPMMRTPRMWRSEYHTRTSIRCLHVHYPSRCQLPPGPGQEGFLSRSFRNKLDPSELRKLAPSLGDASVSAANLPIALETNT